MLAFAPLGTAAASDAERASVLRLRAEGLEAQGRCDEAIALAERARAEGVADAGLGLVAGRCQVRARRYVEALDTLAEARELPPPLPEVDLYHGIAAYHLDDFEQARRDLEAARTGGASGALVDLYTGLLALQADDARGGALALERARRGDASVDPVASYYAFLAWRREGDEERAEQALANLRQSDPDGPWVAEAERVLARERVGGPLQTWLELSAGMEYDDNVVLRGSGVSARDISDERDARGVWAADGGVELFRTEDWSGGLLAAYSGNAHTDLNEFDTHYPVVSGYVDRRFGEDTTARLRYDFGYGWVDYDDYIETHTTTASVYQLWESAGITEMGALTFYHDFFEQQSGTAQASNVCNHLDREGVGVGAFAEHRAPVLDEVELIGSYRYVHYASDGCEWDYDAHEVLAGADVLLPWELLFESFVSFTYQPFESKSFFSKADGTGRAREPTRRDRVWRTGAAFERPVTPAISVRAEYHYADTGSSTDSYDYDRHIAGGYVIWRFR